MSPTTSDAAILAAIPAEGIAFPDLSAELGLTQRKLHPLIARLVRRGVLVSELRDGVRWLRRDGHTVDSLTRALAACHAELAAKDAALTRIERAASRARGGAR